MKTCNHNNSYDECHICVPDTGLPRVVVVGGGFAGLTLIKRLRNKPLQVVLIDKGNYHQFLPLLYQVATSGIEPDSIVFPFRKIFRNFDNVLYRMAEVTRINIPDNQLETNIGIIDYDYLVLATGSVTNFYGNQSVADYGIGLKSVTDALDIRSHLLQNLEKAANTCNLADKEALSNVVIVGGGPAGVEMAGALAEFKRYVRPKDYPELSNIDMHIFLVEASGKLLQDMPAVLSEKALAYLKQLDVQVLLNTTVEAYTGEFVKLGNAETISAAALYWTAGIKGEAPEGLPADVMNRQGRLMVDRINLLATSDNIFAIGDLAVMKTEKYPKGHPMVAQVAIQQGRKLADNLLALIANKQTGPFEYKDKGSLATIGKKKAVARLGKLLLSGFPAWMIWSFVHLMSLIGARNKFRIGLNWLWSYFSYDKGDRVIIRKYVARYEKQKQSVQSTFN